MNLRASVSAVEYETGLRSYLTSIYNWMILGMLVSMGTAILSETTGLVDIMKQGGILFWVVTLLPFVLIFFMGAATAGATSIATLAGAFLFFAALEGVSLSLILSRYTGQSIAVAFAATAAAFAGLSLWGYTTKRNLTGMGNFFLMALIGLIVALVISSLVGSLGFSLLVNAVGVLIFAGLVAYDTQVMRSNYRAGDADTNSRFAIWHALDLYLDFLNLFLFLLRFAGESSDD